MSEQFKTGRDVLDRLLARLDEPAPETSDTLRTEAKRSLAMAFRILERLNDAGKTTRIIEDTVDIIRGFTELDEVKIREQELFKQLGQAKYENEWLKKKYKQLHGKDYEG